MSTTPRTDAECIQIYNEDVTGCSDARDYVDASFARHLETELATAKAEAAHYMSVAQKATDELVRLRADNLTAHEMACAAGLERDRLRAEAEALKQSIESGQRVLREDAERNAARAERAEAECLEQARLLGKSGEREADLLGKLERLAKDTARLDWLEANPEAVKASSVFKSTFGRKIWWRGAGGDYDTARAAIDAAMKP